MQLPVATAANCHQSLANRTAALPVSTIMKVPYEEMWLIPYWAEKLGKTKMVARQLSRRGGTIYCEMRGDRVGIGGHAALYARGELSLP